MLFMGGKDEPGVETEAGLSEGGGPRAESKVQVGGTRERTEFQERRPADVSAQYLDQKGSSFIPCAFIPSVNQQMLEK